MNIQPYSGISNYLKNEFGEKVIKISIDGGFTCPNRDGTKGTGGCIFCSEKGSGEFAASKYLSLEEQFEQQKKLLSAKWSASKFIIYFQSYTNTYAPVSVLKEKFEAAIKLPGVVGIAIATRPDCLGEDVIQLLAEINKKTFLWIELGLQTIHDKTAVLINRQYKLNEFDEAIEKLSAENIKTVVHLIFGLPGETQSDMLDSLNYVCNKRPFGLKFHILNVIKNTPLAEMYQKGLFKTFEKADYIDFISKILLDLPKEITIHRLTGDAFSADLIAPLWVSDKRSVLNGINQKLAQSNKK